MHDSPAAAFDAFAHAVLTLAIGGIAVAVAAAAVERILAAAAFRRALWQSAILGVYILMIIEATGLSRAVSVLWGRIGDAPIEQAAGNSEPRVPPHLWDDPPMSVERWETGGDWGMDALPHNENLAGRPGFQQRSPRRPGDGIIASRYRSSGARWPPYWSD